MKKLISFTLATVMTMMFCVSAFANEAGVSTGSYTADVTGSFVEGWEGNGTIYSVNINWDGLDFTYHEERGPVWDPETLTYSETQPAYWEDNGSITVSNRSNAVVKALPTFANADGFADVDMFFSHEKLYLASAADEGTEQSATITVTPTGSLAQCADNTTIGTITLTIGNSDLDFSTKDNVDTAKSLLMNQLNDYMSAGGHYPESVSSADEVARGEKYTLQSEVSRVYSAEYNQFDTLARGSEYTEAQITKAYIDAYNAVFGLVHIKQ